MSDEDLIELGKQEIEKTGLARYGDVVQEHYQAACLTKLGITTSQSQPFRLERVAVLYVNHLLLWRWLWYPSFDYYLAFRQQLHSLAALIRQ